MGHTPRDRQTAHVRRSHATERDIGYYLHIPERAPADEPLPLLVFLHGASERGNGQDELPRVKHLGPPRLIDEGRSLPFVVISPQLPRWVPGWLPELVDEVVDWAEIEHPIDPARRYVTGVSMGGFGTWMYAAAYPHKVAAIAPICGGGEPRVACALREVPVWAFHGADDLIVEPFYTVRMIAALGRCDPPPVEEPRLTIYPGVGHDAWTRTYDGSAGHDVFGWLRAHRRESATVPT